MTDSFLLISIWVFVVWVLYKPQNRPLSDGLYKFPTQHTKVDHFPDGAHNNLLLKHWSAFSLSRSNEHFCPSLRLIDVE